MCISTVADQAVKVKAASPTYTVKFAEILMVYIDGLPTELLSTASD